MKSSLSSATMKTGWTNTNCSLILEMRKYKNESNLIEGCQSRVWLQADLSDEGKIHFQAESDALIVKGIITLLIRVLNDQTPDDILNADLYFIDQIGLREHLSPTRSNGLLAMMKQMRMYALAFKAKQG